MLKTPEGNEGSMEKGGELPPFLEREQGRIFIIYHEGADLAEDYNNFLKQIGKKADSPPSFLELEEDGSIHTLYEDEDVTERWEEWLKKLQPLE